jgi:hypothetical protein
MTRNFLLAMALLSLALAGGCAKGGNGIIPPSPSVAVTITSPSNTNPIAIYPTQSLTLTAKVTNSTTTAVTWTCTPTAACAMFVPVSPVTTPATATYVAPATPTSATVTATLTGTSVAGSLDLNVIPVTVVVTPTTVNVGQNLVQQFTAVAVPDDAPQIFTWNVTCNNGSNCGSISFDPNKSDVGVYTAGSVNQSVTVAATSSVQQTTPAVATSKVTVVTSRIATGAYGFRFSGDDKNGNHLAVAGSLNVAANGSITGVADVLPAPPGGNPLTITSGSYAPSPNNGNDISNNLGTLTLNSTNGTTSATNIYTAVITSSGILRIIESAADNTGITGSGVMQKSSTQFNAGAQTFVFGFTGVDSSSPAKRVGYAGMLILDGSGNIKTGSALDSNDNGTTNGLCGTPPCNVGGSYAQDLINTGLWHLTLTTGVTQKFDFVIAGGTAQTKTAAGPLTLYAISTDPVDSTHPALSGNMVYQVPMTYNNAAFNGSSVSSMTGANANVSLTVGTTDGTSGGTGGAGGFTGTFDQNNNGTITSVPTTKPFAYTYVATPNINGRYTFQMLGNTNPVVAPLPFVLYASGANRGFLLDQSSPAVITGSMEPQLPAGFNYTPSELPGTYAAATIANSDSGVEPVVQNLLLTSPGGTPLVYDVTGVQNTTNGSQSLTGTYTMLNNNTGGGTGTITLTSPPPPAVANYVIYAIDASSSNSVITDFMMMGVTSGTPSSIIFAQQ